MYRITTLLGIMIATLLAGACATNQHERKPLEEKLADQDFTLGEEIDRIQDYRIDGWYYVDDYNVVFRGGPSAYYLLSFNGRCANLRGAHTIGFSTTAGRVTRFDQLLVRDGSGMPSEKCLIQSIHRVNKSG